MFSALSLTFGSALCKASGASQSLRQGLVVETGTAGGARGRRRTFGMHIAWPNLSIMLSFVSINYPCVTGLKVLLDTGLCRRKKSPHRA
jgi:hypothetical protein